MSNYIKHTAISPYRGKWVNTMNFRFYLSDDLVGEYVEVQSGFSTDGCSIPMILGCFMQKVSATTIKACIVHDYLFQVRKIKSDTGNIRQVGYNEANKIFLNALKVSGVNLIQRYAMYIAVQLFSWIIFYFFSDYRKNKKK